MPRETLVEPDGRDLLRGFLTAILTPQNDPLARFQPRIGGDQHYSGDLQRFDPGPGRHNVSHSLVPGSQVASMKGVRILGQTHRRPVARVRQSGLSAATKVLTR